MLDTNAWLDLLVFDDAASAPLARALAAGKLEAVVDDATCAEFERVLGYPALALEPAQRERVAARMRALAVHLATTSVPPPLPRCRDPDDQMFLALAAAAGARWLLTRDAELLRLSARTRRDAGFDVLTPADWAARAAAAGQISNR